MRERRTLAISTSILGCWPGRCGGGDSTLMSFGQVASVPVQEAPACDGEQMAAPGAVLAI
jgi:hypothetical protein